MWNVRYTRLDKHTIE